MHSILPVTFSSEVDLMLLKKKILFVDLLSVVLCAFIVVSNLAYKTSAECIKIQIIAEKNNYIESQLGKKKQGAGIPRRNCTGRKKNEAVLPQICI